jgi:DNA repair protein RadD
MLGQGFDHPKLSVAAILRPFRSLAPYIQFVGRIQPVVVQTIPRIRTTTGISSPVTHVGINLDEQLKRFKQFENDDPTTRHSGKKLSVRRLTRCSF